MGLCQPWALEQDRCRPAGGCCPQDAAHVPGEQQGRHCPPSSHLQALIVNSRSGSRQLSCQTCTTAHVGKGRPAQEACLTGLPSGQCGSMLMQQPGHAPWLTQTLPCKSSQLLHQTYVSSLPAGRAGAWPAGWPRQARSCAAAADSSIGTVWPWLLSRVMTPCIAIAVRQASMLPPHPAQELNAAGLVNVVWSIAKTDHASRLTHRLLEAVAGEGDRATLMGPEPPKALSWDCAGHLVKQACPRHQQH